MSQDLNARIRQAQPTPHQTRPLVVWLSGLALVALLNVHGCGVREDDEDDVYQTLLQSERQIRESLQKQHTLDAEDDLAIRLVQSSPAPDSVGTVSNWVARTLSSYEMALFPRWVARKAATGRYDVRFLCLVSEPSEAAHPIGFAWSADLALQVVRGPRNLSEDELREEWRGRMRFPARPAASPKETPP